MDSLASTVSEVSAENDENLSRESVDILQNLYLQVVHQPVTFTAGGFFEINMELFASMITGVVSYEIILVQFYAS